MLRLASPRREFLGVQLAVIIEDGCLACAPRLDELKQLVLTEVRDGVVDHAMDEGRPKVHQHLLLTMPALPICGLRRAVAAVAVRAAAPVVWGPDAP